MYGIVMARHKKYPELKETGLFGRKELVLLTSDMVRLLHALVYFKFSY